MAGNCCRGTSRTGNDSKYPPVWQHPWWECEGLVPHRNTGLRPAPREVLDAQANVFYLPVWQDPQLATKCFAHFKVNLI